MTRALQLAIATALVLVHKTAAQCLNNVGAFNPNLRTQTGNLTWLIVPVPRNVVQAALNADPKYILNPPQLQPVPNDPTLFPNGFPTGFHPVIASSGYLNDIRLSALQLDGALQFSLTTIPYVSTSQSPNLPIAAPLNGYISGTDAALLQDFAGLVPSVASGAAFGIDLRFGSLLPGDAAYQRDGPDRFSVNARWNVAANPLTGPGVYIPAVDLRFLTALFSAQSLYTDKALRALINQPLLTAGPLRAVGECIRMTYFLGNDTAGVVRRTGTVIFGPAADGVGLVTGEFVEGRSGGLYEGGEGLSGCAQTVAYVPEGCADAVARLDGRSLE